MHTQTLDESNTPLTYTNRITANAVVIERSLQRSNQNSLPFPKSSIELRQSGHWEISRRSALSHFM